MDELGREFPSGLVVIGGYAVYLHTIKRGVAGAEQTSDGDLMIARDAYEKLKSQKDITSNPRLGKHKFKVGSVGFDVYLEYEENELPLDYSEINSHSQTINGVRVASLEHLLVFKLRAFHDRKNSEHGDKDGRDIIKIITMMPIPHVEILVDHLRKTDLEALSAIGAESKMFLHSVDGNTHQAAQLRKAYQQNLGALKDGLRKTLEKQNGNNR